MYSIDPKVYETYKKSEKKTGSDSKKLKQVIGNRSGDLLRLTCDHLQRGNAAYTPFTLAEDPASA